MGKQEQTVYTCDGPDYGGACPKRILSRSDGVVVRGDIHAGPPTGNFLPTAELVLCWPCFHKLFKEDSVLSDALQGKSMAESRLAEERRKSAERVDQIRYEPDPYVDPRPYKGPSGPLPPPKLPRCVAVIASLTRVTT